MENKGKFWHRKGATPFAIPASEYEKSGTGRKIVNPHLETLTKELKTYQLFSIIVSDLQGIITPLTLQAKIYDMKDGMLQFGPKNGTPYSRYATEDDYKGNIRQYPIYCFSTPIKNYEEKEEGDKIPLNMLKQFLNNYPSAAWWHNGNQDPSCQFHGLHLHIIVDPATNDIYNQRKVKTMTSSMRKSGISFRSQKVASREGILTYLQTPPRMLIGRNNLRMLSWIAATGGRAGLFPEPDMERYCTPEYSNCRDNDDIKGKDTASGFFQNQLELNKDEGNSGKVITIAEMIKNPPTSYQEALKGQKKAVAKTDQPNRSAKRIDTIIDYIKEYDSTVPEILTSKVQESGDKDRLLQWRTIVTANNFRSQALTEIRNLDEKAGITYIDKLHDWEPEIEDQMKIMTIHETGKLFMDWCVEQNLVAANLLTKMYVILAKKNPKRNTLLLHGASNAGKTFWCSALAPLQEVTGQTIQSADFAWSKYIDKDVIMIPELSFSKPEQVEESKKIFEGLATQVNIKNKEARMLRRTPILLQCNTLPWARQFAQEREAFLNRSFNHLDLQESECLMDLTLGPNPKFFAKVMKSL